MNALGRLLIGFGLLLAAVGAVLLLLSRTGLPIGRLPGDLTWRGRHTTVYFPLGTSVLLSVILSLIFYVLSRLRR